MPVSFKKGKDKVVASIKGDIDHHTASALRETIDTAIAELDSKYIILDFNDVTFMDSSGIGLVMGRYRLAKSLDKTVSVVNLAERDFRIMQMSGIEKIAQINKKGN